MTTLQAIKLLAEQIEYVYETLYEFQPSNLDAELELETDRHCIYIIYKNIGEGEVGDIRLTFLKKYISGKWVKIGGVLGINEILLIDTFKNMIKEHYALKLSEYNEKYAAEIAEKESEYYREMYYNNKMCLSLGK